METVLAKFDFAENNSNIINNAVDILKKGGLVAFKTETVYGLGSDGLNSDSCKKIYEAKGRPSDNPLILHVSDIKMLNSVSLNVSDKAVKLIEKFSPGPITFIFEKKECVPYETTGGLNTVAVRIPDDEIALSLIKRFDKPIAAPSANSSGRPSPTKASHVLFDLDGKIDLIIDGGDCQVGIESTIIDMTKDVPIIVRPGFITKKMIENVIGEVLVDEPLNDELDFKPIAPGMKYKHYAPDANIILVKGNNPHEYINDKIDHTNFKMGVVTFSESKHLYTHKNVLIIGSKNEPDAIMKNLFKILRKLDILGLELVYFEVFETLDEKYQAVLNRLNKAASYNYIEL